MFKTSWTYIRWPYPWSKSGLGKEMWKGAEESRLEKKEGKEVFWEEGKEVLWEEGKEVLWEEGEKVLWEEGKEVLWEEWEELMWDEGKELLWEEGNEILWCEGEVAWWKEVCAFAGKEKEGWKEDAARKDIYNEGKIGR